MKKIYICIPRNVMEQSEFIERYEEIKKSLNPEIEVLPGFFSSVEHEKELVAEVLWPDEVQNRLSCILLGKRIELIAEADIVVMGDGWEDDFECVIERQVAEHFGKDVSNFKFSSDEILNEINKKLILDGCEPIFL